MSQSISKNQNKKKIKVKTINEEITQKITKQYVCPDSVVDSNEVNKSIEVLLKEFPNLTNKVISSVLHLSDYELAVTRAKLSNGIPDEGNWDSIDKKKKTNLKNKQLSNANLMNTNNLQKSDPTNTDNNNFNEKKINKKPPKKKTNTTIDELKNVMEITCISENVDLSTSNDLNTINTLVQFKEKLIKDQNDKLKKIKDYFNSFENSLNELELVVSCAINHMSSENIKHINASIIKLDEKVIPIQDNSSLICKRTIESVINSNGYNFRFDEIFQDISKTLVESLSKAKEFIGFIGTNDTESIKKLASNVVDTQNIINYKILPTNMNLSVKPFIESKKLNEHMDISVNQVNDSNKNKDNNSFKPEYDGVLINPHDMIKKMMTEKLGQQSYVNKNEKYVKKTNNVKVSQIHAKNKSNNDALTNKSVRKITSTKINEINDSDSKLAKIKPLKTFES